MVTAPLNTRSIACSTSAGLAAGRSGALLTAAVSTVDPAPCGIGFSSTRGGGGALAQLDEKTHATTINNRQPNPDGLLKMFERVCKRSEAQSFFICHISYAICHMKYGIWHMATPLE